MELKWQESFRQLYCSYSSCNLMLTSVLCFMFIFNFLTWILPWITAVHRTNKISATTMEVNRHNPQTQHLRSIISSLLNRVNVHPVSSLTCNKDHSSAFTWLHWYHFNAKILYIISDARIKWIYFLLQKFPRTPALSVCCFVPLQKSSLQYMISSEIAGTCR